jgi:hypothetical protein
MVAGSALAAAALGACATSEAPHGVDDSASTSPEAGLDASKVAEASATDATADAADASKDSAADAGPFDAGPDTALPFDAGPSPCESGGIVVGAFQTFTNGMVGCAGIVEWANASTLCNPAAGCQVCRAAEWISKSGGIAPSHDYWTADDLKWSGANLACSVSLTTGTDCGDTPMRVCVDGNATDPNGNMCNWSNCGYEANTPNDHFGGCEGNTTAGTVCCCP